MSGPHPRGYTWGETRALLAPVLDVDDPEDIADLAMVFRDPAGDIHVRSCNLSRNDMLAALGAAVLLVACGETDSRDVAEPGADADGPQSCTRCGALIDPRFLAQHSSLHTLEDLS